MTPHSASTSLRRSASQRTLQTLRGSRCDAKRRGLGISTLSVGTRTRARLQRHAYWPLIVIFMLVILAPARAAHVPHIGIVVGPEAPELERFAASELKAIIERLFDVNCVVGDQIPSEVSPLILVGSPTTNPAVARVVGESWPRRGARSR